MNFTTVGGRRFFMAMGAGITSSILVWFGKVTPDAWAVVVIGTVAAYITGSTVESVRTPK